MVKAIGNDSVSTSSLHRILQRCEHTSGLHTDAVFHHCCNAGALSLGGGLRKSRVEDATLAVGQQFLYLRATQRARITTLHQGFRNHRAVGRSMGAPATLLPAACAHHKLLPALLRLTSENLPPTSALHHRALRAVKWKSDFQIAQSLSCRLLQK